MNLTRTTASCAFLLLLSSVASGQEVDYVREFDLQAGRNGRPPLGTFWVSVPFLPDIPDAANTAAREANKCVGDPTGPAEGDGILNADDLICHWWTARSASPVASTFSLSALRSSDCTHVTRVGAIALGAPRFTGTPFLLDATQGLQVLVGVPTGSTYLAENDARVSGDNDDAWPGRLIEYAPTCAGGQTTNCCGSNARRFHLIAVPHDALVTSADEILCGLEGVDWSDMNGDGKPDTCWDDADGDRVRDPGEAPTGLFDGRTTMTIHDTEQLPGQPSYLVSRHVTYRLGQLFFLGINFPVETGDAFLVELQNGHQPTLWRPATN